VRLTRRLSSSEPEHKGSLTKLILKSWVEFLKLHLFEQNILYNKMAEKVSFIKYCSRNRKCVFVFKVFKVLKQLVFC